ncbi:MFS transporter [Legionella maceachernii]|uniref:Major facilitator family transporter n=1 Tax=Legionella maceachernii TaxID=466 RepID=A0A0W0VYY9_9GAMM|nr:MFS transporter [Legionella maceachernii]KTD25209.1 major facilitator family transporter [Legionella maceachernii]SJZ76470.1 Predicted arabinose efflux permease, MFS family [Legionella maceachernii]SUP03114.1 Arabinose efflux permease [Legionella maceachernii]
MNTSITRVAAWAIWIIASLFYAYQYILRVMPNIMLDNFIQQFHIDTTVFGQFSGVYYLGYSLMHLPIGIMLDRFGPKKVMSSCILLTVIGLLPILFAERWMYPMIGRALIGMGSSAAILGTFKIIRMAFKEQQFTRMLSFSVTIGLIGAIYGGGPVSYLCTHLGYKTVVEIFAFFGILLAALTYFIVPEIEKDIQPHSIMADIKRVLTNRQVIALCLLSGLMVGPLEGFADVWGSAFIKRVYGFDPTLASYLPSMIFIGMCFGAPVLSFIAEKTNNYLGVIIGAGIAMMLVFLALISKQFTANTMALSFILVGVCSAYQILAIYKASTYLPEQVAGITTAIANMIIMSFGYAFHTSIGFLIHTFGGSGVSSAFIYGLSVIPLTLAIAVIGFFALFYQERGKTAFISGNAAL